MPHDNHVPAIIPDNGPHTDLQRPRPDWEISVLERDLHVNLGDLGGGGDYVADARVHVTEADGTSWTGLTILP